MQLLNKYYTVIYDSKKQLLLIGPATSILSRGQLYLKDNVTMSKLCNEKCDLDL